MRISAKIVTAISLSALLSFTFGCSDKKPNNAKRNHIIMVGSSTISPFATAIAEEFSRLQYDKNNPLPTPIVESTGTRHGLELFCQGVGLQFPDFTNASRQIEQGEIDRCARNGVNNIIEIKIGYDGIVIGEFKRNKAQQSKLTNLTKEHLFLALAEKIYDKKSEKFIANPYKNWNEIDAKLPNTPILVYGPPLSSGTRDVFHEMIMEDACFAKREFIDAFPIYEERKEQCHAMRKDGAFVESGENEDIVIHSLKANPNAIGIIGFNFLVTNSNNIEAININGVSPNAATIASKKYPLSRPLFIYFKKEHLKLLPGFEDLIKQIIDSETIGSKGYLINSGLIPLSAKDLKEVQSKVLQELK